MLQVLSRLWVLYICTHIHIHTYIYMLQVLSRLWVLLEVHAAVSQREGTGARGHAASSQREAGEIASSLPVVSVHGPARELLAPGP